MYLYPVMLKDAVLLTAAAEETTVDAAVDTAVAVTVVEAAEAFTPFSWYI
jgi:hypothetical protein